VKPIAWITGAAGLLGNYFVQVAPQFAPEWEVVGLKREDLDLLDTENVRRKFAEQKPRLIIHCAALSRSPDCQAKPELARRINVEATVLLAELAESIPFVFISSDLVFDGKNGSYHEASPVNPLSVYAETKVAAEKIVLSNARHLVVRTSLNAGASVTGGRGFNELLRLAWQRGEKPRLFTDEFRSPIAAAVTARAIWELVNFKCIGLFHVAGSERLSRYDTGRLIAARWPKLRPGIEAVSCKEFQNPPRPPDTSLNCMKAQNFLSFQLPAFSDWLREHRKEVI
jgi:dTDP-4-dehydrorhamnose reductase